MKKKTKKELIELLKNEIIKFNKYRSDTNYEKIELSNANLRNANLENANLENANLRNANLRNANLRNANLRNANLENAYLENANLENANLENANLRNANLENANLENANLRNANLENANLRDANLRNANLENANLRNANLENANLRDAYLLFNQLNNYQKSIFDICGKGKIIGYKKILINNINYVIKIIIPEKAKRLNALSSRKCRAEYAIFNSVICMHPLEFFLLLKIGKGYGYNNYEYVLEKGHRIIPDSFDENNKECSNGIHFFITKEEAANY